jgi:hypothetical protein
MVKRKRQSPAQKASRAKANEAKKQKRISTSDAPPPAHDVFAKAVSLKTKALIKKTAMPDGVMRQKAGRKNGTTDIVVRKKRGEVLPVKTLDGAEVRRRLEASSFAFDERHAFRVDKRSDPHVADPRFDRRKDDRTQDAKKRASWPHTFHSRSYAR